VLVLFVVNTNMCWQMSGFVSARID